MICHRTTIADRRESPVHKRVRLILSSHCSNTCLLLFTIFLFLLAHYTLSSYQNTIQSLLVGGVLEEKSSDKNNAVTNDIIPIETPISTTKSTAKANEEKDQKTPWLLESCDDEIPVCRKADVVFKRKVTFCSAQKVASSTTKDYFMRISDGEVIIPEGAKFGAHAANWTQLSAVDPSTRQSMMTSPEWTHVFFIRNVLERFISGYLDKIQNGRCLEEPKTIVLAHYVELGFSCENKGKLGSFLSFLESLPTKEWESHFAPQTPMCNAKEYPYTDIIMADEHLNDKLKELSDKLGVPHPAENPKTSSHATGAKNKLMDIFLGKEQLIPRILNLFEEDCVMFPNLCDVDDLLQSLANHTNNK